MRIDAGCWLIVGALLAGCSGDATGPEAVPESRLTFARYDDRYPLETYQGVFWAVKGQDRTLTIRYAAHGPDEDGDECMTFHVPAQALSRAPDGRVYQPGDSVRITVTVDPERYLFRFEPSGLVFDAARPAELAVRFTYADSDLDGDGDVDAADAALRANLRLWRQERPGAPWIRLDTRRPSSEMVVSEIRGFTGFALAS